MDPEQIARVCHEANRALQIEQDDPTVPVSPSWDDLDDETRESAMAGVANVMAGASPEDSHESWRKFKRERGWTYGPIKDERRKTHPCMRPYKELEDHFKVKDHLFVAIVEALT